MGKDVIFDYSKAAAFIHEEEIAEDEAHAGRGHGAKDRPSFAG